MTIDQRAGEEVRTTAYPTHNGKQPPPTWRGQSVHPIIAHWIDQLMAKQPVIELASRDNYMDVTLFVASNGGFAKPPAIILK